MDQPARTDQPPAVSRVRRAPFLLQIFAPLLIIGAVLAAILLLPPLFTVHQGQPLTSRFLPSTTLTDPRAALAELLQQPTRLRERMAAGPTWLLADLPDPTYRASADLLLPLHALRSVRCWLLERPGVSQNRAAEILVPVQLHTDVLGTRLLLPGTTSAHQALCRMDPVVAGQASLEHWDHTRLADTAASTARAIGLVQGGLLTLALFLAVIAFTTREKPYVLLVGWLIGNLRLGAWALGWDYQWLGFLIDPAYLPGIRKLTLVACYLLTFHLFVSLFQRNLDPVTQRRIRHTGNLGGILLLAATLALPYAWFQSAMFLAAWLGTGLIAVLLIHALCRSHSRARLWHTIGVCIASAILLTGLILVALEQCKAVDAQTGTLILLLCNLLIALAVADQMRESRQTDLRERNELIAHDSLTPLGLFTLGTTRHFEHLNANARKILGIAPEAAASARSWAEFFPAVDWPAVAFATGQGSDTEIELRAQGTAARPRSFLLRATLAGNRVEGSLQDVGARSETLRNLRLMADSDPLTDTLNRRGIEAALQKSIDALQTDGTPAALAFLDLDHVKRVNDLFGHTTSDTLLQMISDRLKYSLGEQQRLGHIGNSEFIILFPRLHANEARSIGQDIVDSLNAAPFFVGEHAFQIKSAMGIIDVDAHMSTRDAIAAASRACQDARKRHTDVVLYEHNAAELFDHINEQHLFEQLDREQPPRDLYLEMQPIVSLRNPLGSLDFEALLRARAAGRQAVQTSHLIRTAEDDGIITAIDKWVFVTILDWLAQHHQKLGQTRQINVNLSGVSLNDNRFVDTLFGILGERPQFARRLCVEITEGVALQDLERTRQFMRRLQRMGTRVALDDFGAGYTSFSYLKELPADMIKIDGTLIRDMLGNRSATAIVASIVDLAHNLGMECIAEWAEDVATIRALTAMGVDYVQGYAISPSRPLGDMLAHDNVLPLVRDPAVRTYLEELSHEMA